MTRRQLMLASVAAGALLLAGCSEKERMEAIRAKEAVEKYKIDVAAITQRRKDELDAVTAQRWDELESGVLKVLAIVGSIGGVIGFIAYSIRRLGERHLAERTTRHEMNLKAIVADPHLSPESREKLYRTAVEAAKWLDLAFEMSESGFASAERIEAEIAEGRDDTSGGFLGILGELTRAFACLSDPILLESVSPPFDFCLSQLCESDQTYNLYLMPPAEFVEAWAAVLKTFFVAARTYKARAPAAPRQTWLLDECGNLGAFPLVIRLYSRDAGLGLRVWSFWQSTKQMNAIAPNGESLLMASAACRTFFGIRDEATANSLSGMLGSQTLGYLDPRQHETARHGAIRAARSLFGGGNPVGAALELAHHRRMASLPVLKERRLMTPDELLGLPPDKMLIFTDGLAHPIYANRRAYYDEPALAGRYHPNPHFPPDTHVRVATPRGYVWRPVIRERVHPAFGHFPQYADGYWSRIG